MACRTRLFVLRPDATTMSSRDSAARAPGRPVESDRPKRAVPEGRLRDGPLLTIDDVAARCHVSTKSVRRWIAAHELIAARLGVQWRVRAQDLEHFIRERLTR